MSVITSMRRQVAVYWPRNASPDRFGKYAYGDPVEVKCRWDDASQEYRDNKGEKQYSVATVYPDRVMAIGDKLKKDELDSFTPLDPADDLGAFEIRHFKQIPNFKNTQTLYIAYLGGTG